MSICIEVCVILFYLECANYAEVINEFERDQDIFYLKRRICRLVSYFLVFYCLYSVRPMFLELYGFCLDCLYLVLRLLRHNLLVFPRLIKAFFRAIRFTAENLISSFKPESFLPIILYFFLFFTEC